MERRLGVALAATGFVAALLLLTVGHHSAASGAAIAAIPTDFEARLRETTAGVEARAETLAQLPRLGWIVATDAATVGDLTADELEFRLHPGELIELAQVRNSDGQVRVLRRLPAGSNLPLPMARPGLELLVSGGRTYVVTIVSIQPRARIGEIRGTLAVGKEVETIDLARQLDRLGAGARLDTRTGSMTVGRAAPVTGKGAVSFPLGGPAAAGATLVLSRTTGGGWARVVAGLVLALSLAGAARLWRRGDGPAEALRPPEPARAGGGLPASAAGMIVVDDDPERDLERDPQRGEDSSGDDLTLDPDATVLADPGAVGRAAIARTRSGSVPIVLSTTRPTGPRDRVAATADADPTTDEYRALFVEYVNLRRTCGEPVEGLDRDEFVETLRIARSRLIREDAISDVRFRLAFHNGRAIIRFTTVP